MTSKEQQGIGPKTDRRGFLKIFAGVSAALATGNVEQAANILATSAIATPGLRKKNRAGEISYKFVGALNIISNHAEQPDRFDVDSLLQHYIDNRQSEYRGETFFDVLQDELKTAHWRIASHDSSLETLLKSDKQREALRDTFAHHKALKQTLDGLIDEMKSNGMADKIIPGFSDIVMGFIDKGRIDGEVFDELMHKYDEGKLPWISHVKIPDNLYVSPYGSADKYLAKIMDGLPAKISQAVNKLRNSYDSNVFSPLHHFEDRHALDRIDQQLPEFAGHKSRVEEETKENTRNLQEKEQMRAKKEKMNSLERRMRPHVYQRFEITR